MTSVAYFVFTFMACILGAGLGLFLHRARLARRAAAGIAEPDLSRGDEDAKWDTISQWQHQENRVFAGWVSACAATPLVLAAAGWGNRNEVVGTICSGLSSFAVHSPLCF